MSSDRRHGWAGSALQDGAPSAAARKQSDAATTLGRREFATGLALAGAALLGGVRKASANPNDAVKDRLMDFKDLVCQISGHVQENRLEGPLQEQADIDYITERIYAAAWIAQRLLNRRRSEVFAPPSMWLYWAPPDATGMNLQEATGQACHDACEALELYCEEMENGGSYYEPAAEALWMSQGMLCHIIALAGIEP